MSHIRSLGPEVPGWSIRPEFPATPLQGRLVRLEPLSAEAHGAALYAANAGHVEMWDYMSVGPFASEAEYLAWVQSAEGKADPMFFAILDGSGRAVGVAAYMRIDRANGVCEVGNLAFSLALQRRPEATEAMYLMARQAFALGYRRYEWKCNSKNLPSRRAAQRYGFSYEGTFRNHMVMKGHSRDTAWYAMTDADWPAIDAAFTRWLAPENFDAEGRQRISLAELTAPHLVSRDPVLLGAS